MRRCASLAIAAAAGVLVAAGCGDICHPDVDNEQPRALRIAPGILVKDAIASECDRVDWKDFSYFENVRVTVIYAFGEMYKPHGVHGQIRLFSFDGNEMERQPVVPERRDYKFVFVAQKDKDYFFKIETEKGQAGYMVETKVEPLDACASCPAGSTCCRPTGVCCPPGSTCRDGACVSTGECVPGCGRDEVCVSGRCEEACPGGCPRGKRCDADSRRCVGGGGGTVAPPPARKGCVAEPGMCAADQDCDKATGECRDLAYIKGTVLQVSEEGGGTMMLINRGRDDKVKAGARGSVGSHEFTVGSVTATRCRAKVSARPEEVKGKAVRIFK
ncbi:MAG: hypothetical protein FJ087_11845 [Deltaproteobacteria bacterium]|nr:hypothetical protein [Deltaproteobacteria bacterium]